MYRTWSPLLSHFKKFQLWNPKTVKRLRKFTDAAPQDMKHSSLKRRILGHFLVEDIRILFLDQISDSCCLLGSSARCTKLHLPNQCKITTSAEPCRFRLYRNPSSWCLKSWRFEVSYSFMYTLMQASFLIIQIIK